MNGAEAIQYGIKIHLEAKIYTYLYLVEKTIFSGHCFLQLPTLTILCIRLWPKGIETLIKRPRGARGIYYIIAIIISGIIATPDIISQMVVAIPIILLYEVTIYIVCIFIIPTKGPQGNEENR
jgi:sec-independent protein translocase protein TatC